jgi:hypothetical protein
VPAPRGNEPEIQEEVQRGGKQLNDGAISLHTGAGECAACHLVHAATLNFFLNLWLIPTWGWHGAAWSSLCTDAALAAMSWSILRFQLRQNAYA